MSIMPAALLLDANIWLDNYIGTRASSSSSQRLVDYALAHNITLFYPASILNDVYFVISSSLKRAARANDLALDTKDMSAVHEMAFSCIRNMHEIATAVGTDESDIWLAIKLHSIHRDIEDNLVLAAMERSQASFLVTNDHELIQHANCAAMTSEDMLKYIEGMGN